MGFECVKECLFKVKAEKYGEEDERCCEACDWTDVSVAGVVIRPAVTYRIAKSSTRKLSARTVSLYSLPRSGHVAHEAKPPTLQYRLHV